MDVLELGLADRPAELRSRLDWAPRWQAAQFLRALNRHVDPKRYEALLVLKTARRDVGPTAADRLGTKRIADATLDRRVVC
jgi:hypothetical protein